MGLLTTTWRPTNFPDSIDGQPLVTSIHDLFLDFPYDRLPPSSSSSSIASWFLRPGVVYGLLLFYVLASKPIFTTLSTYTKSNPLWFRMFVAVHNMGLALFSGVCAWNSWRVVFEHYLEKLHQDNGTHSNAFYAIYCDNDGTLWQNGGLGTWSTIFYISKYYEFVDTWILVLKGKQASFLQVYHHTGIAFIMWCAVVSQSAWLLFVVLLNSVIHTIMYIYFFIKTVSPTTEIKAARYLTRAQIGQFLTGIICTIGVLVMGNDCDTESSRFALVCLHVYGYGLIALFFAFAKRKYKTV